jgi:hypothetical protein
MKIIGLTGKAGAGKNYVGDLIKQGVEPKGCYSCSGSGEVEDYHNNTERECYACRGTGVGWSYRIPSFKVELASFAAGLKDTVAAMFCIDRALMDTDEGKKSLTVWRWDDLNRKLREDGVLWGQELRKGNISVRELLQFVGTNLVRDNWCETHWIKLAGQRMAKSNADIYVFTDCRFRNEAEFIRSQGGEVWEITGRYNPAVPQHVSEERDFQVDQVIRNPVGTTNEQLVAQIRGILG